MIDDDTLVIANPGTGKTTNIAEEVVELIKNNIPPDKILCITFTNKAVEGLEKKINKELNDRNIKNVTANDLKIRTFHSFAYEELNEDGTINDIISYNLVRYLIYKKLSELKAFNYSKEYVINDIIPKLENAIRYLKSFGIKPDDIKNNRDEIEKLIIKKHLESVRNINREEEKYLFSYFYEAFNYYENNKKYYDYNDLLFEFIKKKNKSKYEYIFVDELQDVNNIEAEIASISGNKKYFVGDKKQSIFGFQGGALSVFKKLSDNSKINKKYLEKNYRSTDSILNYSKEFYLKYSDDDSVNELTEFSGIKGIGEPVEIIETDEPESSIIEVINELQKKYDGNIGVIARTNDQIDKISKMLDNYNIEYTSDSNIHTVNQAKKDIINFFRGIFYNNNDDTIKAIFSPFSGFTLREAFEISEGLNEGNSSLNFYDTPFFSLRKENFNKETINKIFDENILPIAASISREYFLTATTIKSSLREFFDVESNYTGKNFFDYLELAYSENENESNESKITLTTVHKAKGREFDSAIYLPKKKRKTDSYIDIITSSIISVIKNIDVDNELMGEDIRVNFVAFTRARYNLSILLKPRESDYYYIPDYSIIKKLSSVENSIAIPDKNKYDEAYFLFVNGKFKESKEILNKKDDWLRGLIYNFFRDKSKLSFSLISIDNPYWFLKNYILKLNEKTDALYYGSNAHDFAEAIYEDSLDLQTIPEGYKEVITNIKSVINEIKTRFNMEQIAAEVGAAIRVNQMFDDFKNVDNSITFFGKLDAVFSDGNKYLILDYKTDKNENNINHHRVQLLSYKILYSIKNNININKINTALGYISIRGNINTHKNDIGVVYKEPDKYSEKKLREYISRFLDYKNDPEKYISDLINSDNDDTLFNRLINLLK